MEDVVFDLKNKIIEKCGQISSDGVAMTKEFMVFVQSHPCKASENHYKGNAASLVGKVCQVSDNCCSRGHGDPGYVIAGYCRSSK
jgi:hypothetical protein